jgi:hypothetical protein
MSGTCTRNWAKSLYFSRHEVVDGIELVFLYNLKYTKSFDIYTIFLLLNYLLYFCNVIKMPKI